MGINVPHLPPFVFGIGWFMIGALVLMVLILIILKIRNRNIR